MGLHLAITEPSRARARAQSSDVFVCRLSSRLLLSGKGGEHKGQTRLLEESAKGRGAVAASKRACQRCGDYSGLLSPVKADAPVFAVENQPNRKLTAISTPLMDQLGHEWSCSPHLLSMFSVIDNKK